MTQFVDLRAPCEPTSVLLRKIIPLKNGLITNLNPFFKAFNHLLYLDQIIDETRNEVVIHPEVRIREHIKQRPAAAVIRDYHDAVGLDAGAYNTRIPDYVQILLDLMEICLKTDHSTDKVVDVVVTELPHDLHLFHHLPRNVLYYTRIFSFYG